MAGGGKEDVMSIRRSGVFNPGAVQGVAHLADGGRAIVFPDGQKFGVMKETDRSRKGEEIGAAHTAWEAEDGVPVLLFAEGDFQRICYVIYQAEETPEGVRSLKVDTPCPERTRGYGCSLCTKERPIHSNFRVLGWL